MLPWTGNEGKYLRLICRLSGYCMGRVHLGKCTHSCTEQMHTYLHGTVSLIKFSSRSMHVNVHCEKTVRTFTCKLLVPSKLPITLLFFIFTDINIVKDNSVIIYNSKWSDLKMAVPQSKKLVRTSVYRSFWRSWADLSFAPTFGVWRQILLPTSGVNQGHSIG
jgi:hypothetical protein